MPMRGQIETSARCFHMTKALIKVTIYKLVRVQQHGVHIQKTRASDVIYSKSPNLEKHIATLRKQVKEEN